MVLITFNPLESSGNYFNASLT